MRQRTIRLDHDIALLQPIDDIPPVAPRVNLVLAHVDLAASCLVDVFFEFVEVVDTVVGDSDRADFACLLGFYQGAPGAETGFFAAVGGVEEGPFYLVSFFLRCVVLDG